MLEIDLAQYPPDKRPEVYAKAKAAGMKIVNEELAAREVLDDMQAMGKVKSKALTLDFPGDMPDVRNAPEFFRVSSRKGFDILFDGLPMGPMFCDELEAIAKLRWKEVSEPHIICHVFAAFAFPVRDGANRYGLSIVNPSAMNRVLPKKLRETMGIECYYKESGQRADAIWYKMYRVENKQEQQEFQSKIRAIAMHVQAECATNFASWADRTGE